MLLSAVLISASLTVAGITVLNTGKCLPKFSLTEAITSFLKLVSLELLLYVISERTRKDKAYRPHKGQ